VTARRIVERVSASKSYGTQFRVARDFANLIFHRTPPATVQIIATEQGYYVDHGIEHVTRIVDKLNALEGLLNSRLNVVESFILAVAAYYHDISMFIGRNNEDTPDRVRDQHHTRSAEIIQMLNDRHTLNIGTHELGIIKRVIEAHRQIDIATLPANQRIAGSSVRTQLLGAFIRIADACDCDSSRAPKVIFDLFYDQIPENSIEYWRAHFPVTDATFERLRAAIVLSIDFSGDIQERVEKYRSSNLLKRKLESELDGVEAIFQSYNIPIARVEIRDFNTSNIIDLQSPPAYENVATVFLSSRSERIGVLAQVATPLISNAGDATPLIVEFRPPEGPLFADTAVKIGKNQLDEFQSQLKTSLGDDFRGFEIHSAVEKTTIRRGLAL
jgi:hypothetical protein